MQKSGGGGIKTNNLVVVSLAMVGHYLQSLNAEDAANAHKRFSPVDNLMVCKFLSGKANYYAHIMGVDCLLLLKVISAPFSESSPQ
jgi:hypothetical protein